VNVHLRAPSARARRRGSNDPRRRRIVPFMSRPLTSISAALFDLDGTVIDSFPLIDRCFRHACREVLGREIDEPEGAARWALPLRAWFDHVDPGRAEALVDAYTDLYFRVHDDMITLYPGIAAALDALDAAGFRLAVVTSKRRASARRALATLGLDRYFAAVVAVDDVRAPKPDGEPVSLAAARLGVAASRACMIGDSVHDVRAAAAAGAASVAAMWGTRHRAELLAAGPDVVVEAPQDLIGLLAGPSGAEPRDER
jgi:pyrophosphatase PpaX